MNKLPKLLQLMLAPFFLYAEEPGGGSAPDDSGADWAALNEGVAPGADDEEGGVAVAADDIDPPATQVAKPTSAPEKKADNPDEATSGTDPVEANPTDENLSPEDSLEPTETLTPEEVAARDKKIVEDYAAWKEAQMANLKTSYGFDEETASRLQTEPELVLPELAAKMHMEIMESVVTAVQRLIPNMLPQVLQKQGTEKQAEDFFFGANPDLKKYKKEVLTAGKMYREMNPKATKEDIAAKVGAIVRTSLGLPPLGEQPAEKKAPAKPHRPAQAGSGSGVKPAPQEKDDGNLWSDLADD